MQKNKIFFILNFIVVLFAAIISVGLFTAGFGGIYYASIGAIIKVEAVLSVVFLIALGVYGYKNRGR